MATGWNTRIAHSARNRHTYYTVGCDQIINIGDSLYYSASKNVTNLMVIYSTNTQTTQFVEYPNNINREMHPTMLCKYNNIIYIVNPGAGNIISFNPSSKTFNELLKIPEIKKK
eukprot:318897_1